MSVLTPKGINTLRRQVGVYSVDEELTDLQASSAPPIWNRAVVIEVLFDRRAFSNEKLNSLRSRVTNPDLLDRAPEDSIVAQVVSNAEGHRADTPAVFFPMLSHQTSPLKTGEHVWVMFENPQRSTEQGFWLSRIREPKDVDDLNFTHADRKFDDRNIVTSTERALGVEITQDAPGFPNGANTNESLTLADPLAYKKINEESNAAKAFTPEPVPRFRKRPADHVLHGSNNTMIVLGEDRVGPTVSGQDGEITRPETDKVGKAGFIDIVVGRGRELPSDTGPGELTAPPIIRNSRGNFETDKVTLQQNAQEGDPDFLKDAARISVFMDTTGDINFNTIPSNLPKNFSGEDVSQFDRGSFGVIKSDHVRIIARRDPDALPNAINGSIRIIKEGDTDDEGGTGRASILLEPDGSVLIEGPKIVIGSANLEKGNGEGTQVTLGQGATEPIVMGNILKQLLTDYTNAIKDAVAQLTQTLQVDFGANSLGNLGAPIPGVVTAAVTFTTFNTSINQASTTLQTNIDTMLSKIGKTR